MFASLSHFLIVTPTAEKRRTAFNLTDDKYFGSDVVGFIENKSPDVGVGVVRTCGVCKSSGVSVDNIAAVGIEVYVAVFQGQASVEEEYV